MRISWLDTRALDQSPLTRLTIDDRADTDAVQVVAAVRALVGRMLDDLEPELTALVGLRPCPPRVQRALSVLSQRLAIP